MPEAISVTQLNTYIKQIFDAEEFLHNIPVMGEVFGVSFSRNVIYFSLKDDNSTLPCVCFYPNLIDKIIEGQKLIVTGSPNFYTKGGKLRRIYIPKMLREEALCWLSDKKQESGFIFLNRYGKQITTRGISGQLKKLAVKYGINPAVIYPHSFRHRFAKSFLERCNDISFLADLMGHESIETTRIYLRKTSTEQRELVDSVIDW